MLNTYDRRCSLAVQLRMDNPRPDHQHLLWRPAVNQHQVPVDAGVVPVLRLNVKSPEAAVLLRNQAQLFQTHPREDIVNGIQDYLPRHVVKA